MSSFRLQIVTPERLLFDGDVEKLIVRTAEGDVGILKDHIPYVAAISVGPLKIVQNGTDRTAAIAGGFLRVDQNATTVVAQTCEWSDEIDVERAARAQQKALDRLQSEKGDKELELARYKLRKALNRINIGSK